MSWVEQESAPSLLRLVKYIAFLSRGKSGLLGNDSSVWQDMSWSKQSQNVMIFGSWDDSGICRSAEELTRYLLQCFLSLELL